MTEITYKKYIDITTDLSTEKYYYIRRKEDGVIKVGSPTCYDNTMGTNLFLVISPDGITWMTNAQLSVMYDIIGVVGSINFD